MRPMEHEVRYCTSADGTRIGYTVFGQGPALIHCPALWESIDNPFPWTAEPFSLLHSGRTVVQYDLRGVGLSQREVIDFSIDRMVEDIEAVAASAGLDRFALYGTQLSAALTVLLAARHPRQVLRLLLPRPFFKGSDVISQENLDLLVALMRGNWEMGSQTLSDLSLRRDDPTIGTHSAELLRQNTSADALVGILTDLYRTTDVKTVFPDIQCPTLMAQRREDTLGSFAAVREASAAIPCARLLPLPGDGPVALGDDAAGAFRAMADFLDEDPETRALPVTAGSASASPNAFRTVLFTDLVGHTEMMSRLGDNAGRDVLREHERITREVLAAHDGTEVKTMGDGFMASFGSVTKAVECAIALQRIFAGREGEPLSVRVGLNAGEPIEEDGDLFGATVILASRIAAKADGGKILVADTVRGLCSGKGFLFADQGEFVAKGFEEPVRVSEVRWQE